MPLCLAMNPFSSDIAGISTNPLKLSSTGLGIRLQVSVKEMDENLSNMKMAPSEKVNKKPVTLISRAKGLEMEIYQNRRKWG